MAVFDPRDLIDRTAEQELFTDLLAPDTASRVLIVRDDGGRGKSSLLKRLRYNCRWQHDSLPACIVDLDRLEADPTPFGLVRAILDPGHATSRSSSVYEGFGADVVRRFDRTNRVDRAREDGNRSIFGDEGRAESMTGASEVGVMYGGRAGGMYVENAASVTVHEAADRRGLDKLPGSLERRARALVVDAFFEDLREITATTPLVLLLDGWDRCNLGLREWVHDEMLGNHVLSHDPSRRPGGLRVVVAGRRHVPAREEHGLRSDELRLMFRDDEDYRATVLSIQALSTWTDDHIVEFLRKSGAPEVVDQEVDFIRYSLQKGNPLSSIVRLVDEHLKPRWVV